MGEIEKATGVSTELLTGFSGFLVFPHFAAREVGHSLAYTDEKLKTLAGIDKGPPSRMRRLMPNNVTTTIIQRFSLTAEQSCNLLLPVPFLRFGGRYLSDMSASIRLWPPRWACSRYLV